jgi:hypothetical protein
MGIFLSSEWSPGLGQFWSLAHHWLGAVGFRFCLGFSKGHTLPDPSNSLPTFPIHHRLEQVSDHCELATADSLSSCQVWRVSCCHPGPLPKDLVLLGRDWPLPFLENQSLMWLCSQNKWTNWEQSHISVSHAAEMDMESFLLHLTFQTLQLHEILLPCLEKFQLYNWASKPLESSSKVKERQV